MWSNYKIFYIPVYALPNGEWISTGLVNRSRTRDEAERKAAKMLGAAEISGVVKAVKDI